MLFCMAFFEDIISIGTDNDFVPNMCKLLYIINDDHPWWLRTLMCNQYQAKESYRKISNIRHTKSQNLNVSRLVLQLSLPNPMKPGVKSRMKM